MSSTAPPARRRFLPQPVETSTRTSKRPHPGTPEETIDTEVNMAGEGDTKPTTTKPRRFLPQPVEESTRTSRKKNVDHVEDVTDKPQHSGSIVSMTMDDSTLPGYPTASVPETTRRFAAEPVETTTRTSRRKFAPEPVETTARSSKDKKEQEKDKSTSSRPRRKFAPEPVETTTTRRRRNTDEDMSNESPSESSSETSSALSSRRSSGGRKFAPELIETAKGQFRQGKKEPGSPVPGVLKPPETKTSESESIDGESRFSAASLAKRHHEENRRHSYCVPNLPMIESDSSGEDTTPSMTDTFSETDNEVHGLRPIPEAEGGSFTDYVLSLADKKQLQDQVMAAYINEVQHEPVNHFAVEEDEDDAHGVLSGKNGVDPRTFRRSSQDELDLELERMRKHHQQLEQAKKELAEDTAGASRFSAAALATRHHLQQGAANKAQPKKKDPNDDLAKMRAAASPPMLGDEIKFPYTISPKMTRCDVDQAPRPRRADSGEHEVVPEINTTLWSANVNVTDKSDAGLWMGLCQKGPNDPSRPSTPIKSGIQTPAFEGPNPFDIGTPGTKQASKLFGMSLLSITPSRGSDGIDEFTESIDKKLERERLIEEEFPNSVITQIYNYLSLGYPSLARGFDEELSKISRISIEELRRDDKAALDNARGYIGAPEAEGSWEEDEQGILKGCRRWEALRLYVWEWARQSPTFVKEQTPSSFSYRTNGMGGEAWGSTVRRGSWAQ